VAPAYGITASASPPAASLIEQVLMRVAEWSEHTGPWTFRTGLFRVTSTGKALMRLAARDGTELQVHVGLTAQANRSIRLHARALAALARQSPPPSVEERLPEMPLTAEVHGAVFGVEPCYAGVSGGERIRHAAAREQLCEEALAFLCDWHRATGTTHRIDDALFARLFADPAAAALEWLTKEERHRYGGWFSARTRWMRERVAERTLLVVARHGDFVPANCLVDPRTGALAKVLDWDLHEPEGLPLLDLITFLGCAYRPQVQARMRRLGEDPAQVKFPGYPFVFLKDPLQGWLFRYRERVGLDRRLVLPLLFMWWLKQLQDWAPLHRHNPAWRRLRLVAVMARWDALSGSRGGS
jgi:hypothetical protein